MNKKCIKTLSMLVLAILMIACPLSIGARDYKTVNGDPTKTRIYTLDNGLKVYLSVNKEKPRVTAYIAVNTGHRNDPADCTGLAHYLEHLMFKGTHKFGTSNYAAEAPLLQKISDLYEEYRQLTDAEARKAKYHEIDSVSQIAAQYNIPNEYDKLMATIGSNGTNAHTWYDETVYKEDVPSNEIERWAEVQADRFQNLVLRGFHTELEAVYEEKNISLSNDGEKVFDALMEKLFPSHSYGTQTTIGTQDHLKNPSLVAITNYFNKYYKPNNVAICMAGDMDMDKTIAIIEKYFGSWQPGTDIAPRKFEKQPVFTQPQEATVYGQQEESLVLGWRFDGRASVQNDTIQLISSILQNGKAGLIDLDINQKMMMQSASAGDLSLKEYSVLLLEGAPNKGQSLEEVKSLLLAEVEKLKKGEWDEQLIQSILNNKKRGELRGLDSNLNRVRMMYSAFINGKDWQSVVEENERLARITKADIVAFANKYLNDGYACSYKRQGEDPNIKKIEKPAITPIPSNRDKASDYLKEYSSRKVEPIKPKFVEFNEDLTKSAIQMGPTLFVPEMYVQNTDNDLFDLVYRYDFGDRADVRYATAADYLTLLGTSDMSNEEIQKQFYNLACNYRVSVGNDAINILLSGLKENMVPAMNLMEKILNDAKADKDIYDLYVQNTLKARTDAKKDQKTCFEYLYQYGMYGAKNDYTNIMSEQQLKETDPQVLVDLIKGLASKKHTVLYYGPLTIFELNNVIIKNHTVAASLVAGPKNVDPEYQKTAQNEIIIAPYEANNIYMRMINNEGKPLDFKRLPVITVFNEYFGGGMNGIVFQELRETRGLAYNAWARYNVPSRKQDPELWVQHIISQNDKMMDCINTFNEITTDMPQTEAGFRIAKDNITKSLAAQRTVKMGIINSYIQSQRMGTEKSVSQMIYDALPNITLKDVVNFEQSNVKNHPMRIVILGDEKELDIPALEKIAPIKRVSLEEIFGY